MIMPIDTVHSIKLPYLTISKRLYYHT